MCNAQHVSTRRRTCSRLSLFFLYFFRLAAVTAYIFSYYFIDNYVFVVRPGLLDPRRAPLLSPFADRRRGGTARDGLLEL